MLGVGFLSLGRKPFVGEPRRFPEVQERQKSANSCYEETNGIEDPGGNQFSP